MKLFGKDEGVERRLMEARPEPSTELVDRVGRRIEAARRPRISSRVAFIAAAVTLLLGTVASFGGAAYADNSGAARSSAADQYGPEETPPLGVAPEEAEKIQQASVAAGVKGGSLPFTGISLALTGIVGLGLIGTGVAIRRVERKRSDIRS